MILTFARPSVGARVGSRVVVFGFASEGNAPTPVAPATGFSHDPNIVASPNRLWTRFGFRPVGQSAEIVIPPPPEPPKGGGPALGRYSHHHRKKRSLEEILEEIEENPPRAVRKIGAYEDDLSEQVARLEAAIAKEIKARTDRLSNERLNRAAAIAARRIVQRIMDEEDAATLLLLS